MTQIIDRYHIAEYHLGMESEDLERIRTILAGFASRRGHGVIAEIAEVSDTHRSTVERFLAGHDIKSSNLLAILKGAETLGMEGFSALVSQAHEESLNPYKPASIPLDYKCPDCHEMTPGPPKAIFCMHCGHNLGAICPKCGNWNLPKANLCSDCGHPLTEEGLRIKLEIQRATETRNDKVQRGIVEKQERKRARRKRGEPEI